MSNPLKLLLFISGSIILLFVCWIALDQLFVKEEYSNISKVAQNVEKEYEIIKESMNKKMSDKTNNEGGGWTKVAFDQFDKRNIKKVAKIMVAMAQVENKDLFYQMFHPQKYNKMLLEQSDDEKTDFVKEIMRDISKNQTISGIHVKENKDYLGGSEKEVTITIKYEDNSTRTYKNIPLVSLKNNFEEYDTTIYVFDIQPVELKNYIVH